MRHTLRRGHRRSHHEIKVGEKNGLEAGTGGPRVLVSYQELGQSWVKATGAMEVSEVYILLYVHVVLVAMYDGSWMPVAVSTHTHRQKNTQTYFGGELKIWQAITQKAIFT